MKYAVCPHCGAHLDFGECCDSEEQKAKRGEKDGGDLAATGGAVSRDGD